MLPSVLVDHSLKQSRLWKFRDNAAVGDIFCIPSSAQNTEILPLPGSRVSAANGDDRRGSVEVSPKLLCVRGGLFRSPGEQEQCEVSLTFASTKTRK